MNAGIVTIPPDNAVTLKRAGELLDMDPSSLRRAISQDRIASIKVKTDQNRFGFYHVIATPEIERYRLQPKQKGGGRPRRKQAN